jgi:hypothetical protein
MRWIMAVGSEAYQRTMLAIERAWFSPRRGMFLAAAGCAAVLLALIVASSADTGAAITARPGRVEAGAHAW